MIGMQSFRPNYNTSSALGAVQVQKFGGRETSSKSNTDATHHPHQLCGYAGQILYYKSPLPTATRGEWMDACWGRVCPSLVPLQASPICCHRTREMWLSDIM